MALYKKKYQKRHSKRELRNFYRVRIDRTVYGNVYRECTRSILTPHLLTLKMCYATKPQPRVKMANDWHICTCTTALTANGHTKWIAPRIKKKQKRNRNWTIFLLMLLLTDADSPRLFYLIPSLQHSSFDLTIHARFNHDRKMQQNKLSKFMR